MIDVSSFTKYYLSDPSTVIGRVRVFVKPHFLDVSIDNLSKQWDYHSLEFIQSFLANHRKSHNVGRVPLFVKLDHLIEKLIADRQCLSVARRELGKWMLRIAVQLSQTEESSRVVCDFVFKFKLNRLQLTLDQISRKEWLDEKLRKSVNTKDEKINNIS